MERSARGSIVWLTHEEASFLLGLSAYRFENSDTSRLASRELDEFTRRMEPYDLAKAVERSKRHLN